MFQKHAYGSQVKLLSSPFLRGVLAKLCASETVQPEMNRLVQLLYSQMISVVIDEEFEREIVSTPTRMTKTHPEQLLTTERVKRDQNVVCVNLARAGTYPSHVCYDFLHEAIHQNYIRQDHIFASRLVSANQSISGTELSGYKIGGSIDNAYVLFPDPMGATGTTILSCLDHYRTHVPGTARKMIALHLIVTPEYLAKVLTLNPGVTVYAIRVDRGLSSSKALASLPGEHWTEEKGLNANGYILPGGGGFGEIMNNSFV